MFKSMTRAVIYTQYEHGRLAGTLAHLWGNQTFARPALDFPAFTAGVTLHDWGYGILDNHAIGEVAEGDWLKIIRAGMDKEFDSPTTGIVVKLHLRRLLSLNTSPEREALISRIDDHIARQLNNIRGQPRLETFQRADKITQLCDMISFDFCFESPRQRTLDVYNQPDSAETTEITYEIRPGGEVLVDPWPFSVPAISGILYAFQGQGYPEELNPLVTPFSIRQGEKTKLGVPA